MSQNLLEALDGWSSVKSAELYGVDAWSQGYFTVTDDGLVAVNLKNATGTVCVKLSDIVRGLHDRGMSLPLLLRFSDLLGSRIRLINESFQKAIADYGYQNVYRGVFPIKVNQQQQAVHDVVTFGAPYHHGLEAGSKAELIAALAYMRDPEAFLICNGYKDAEFIDLALSSLKMGLQTILVLETTDELNLILERSAALGIRPRMGIRVKLSSRVGGKWAESGGERSVFGLTPSQVIDVVDELRNAQMLDCLELLHYHLGSQVPNIREIRDSVKEASRFYVGLVKEGARMGIFDIGGGLAIDYDGSHTNFASSANYDVSEYCADVIEGIMTACDEDEVPHPKVISESGRALIGYYSVLVFNVLDAAIHEEWDHPENIPEPLPEALENMMYVSQTLSLKNVQESFNDALYYREEIQKAFKHGDITLRQHAAADCLFWHILTRIRELLPGLKVIPKDLQGLDVLLADVYYCNFSVFQSLPDAWAIDQLFPIMPIHRLTEKPTRMAYLSDITCDCDGRIDKFIDHHNVKSVLPVHTLRKGEPYMLAAFLVGAYQETLGDLHNLFGDTNVVSVQVDEDGEIEYVQELQGDTVGDVLSYVEYRPERLMEQFRSLAEDAVKGKRITPAERREILAAYDNGLRGYTYFEQ
ncbi:MAG: biosynthetic arginine decarboxylase [Kiritimatiellae bacterium]|jgi:arginine decarboxylase|nr:biosynthetic arginine decarboxylase [Kiritimatiellia bacterium]MDD3583654.1 biosynthetic arginine decarboxylase [Kiritimatiellia bacterium]HHU14561.1 biosynthetic arginine decarboxylase [Lentisphaerota bacterium]HON46366.1 biosynthetic arginine decarboxylase [Kiritimatiellia bacterium]HRT28609.1 biosynthetic arginine decarboxylase [Kiritimatiellia bacterium]